MSTQRGKSKRKVDSKLKQLKWLVNYDIKGGESKREMLGKDHKALQ